MYYDFSKLELKDNQYSSDEEEKIDCQNDFTKDSSQFLEREMIQNLDGYGDESEDNKMKMLPDYGAESDFDNSAIEIGSSNI